jgi:alanine dehydrogenase
MRIGIPTEVRVREGRVGLIPAACSALVRAGHAVFVQSGAGRQAGFLDESYAAVGASLVPDAATLYGEARLVVKVKEPQPAEYPLLRPDHTLFCFLHLAANLEVARALCARGLTAVAFETVEVGGRFPLLAPMSEIAGRLAVQIGAHLLHQPQGGKGVLLGGVPGAGRGHVLVIGAGAVGGSAVDAAAGAGARVTVLARDAERLARLRALGGGVTGLFPYPEEIGRLVREADLVVGAVYVAGARTPRLVDRAMVRSMEEGSVIIDVSVDQGGCVETIRATTYDAPTYVDEGVVHFGVVNMPGAVPRSASLALSAAISPWVLELARPDWRERQPALRAAVNTAEGRLVHPALSGLDFSLKISNN